MVSSVITGAVLIIASFSQVISDEFHPLSDAFISYINLKQSSWRAGRNFPAHTSMSYIKGLMGVLKDDHPLTLPVQVHDPDLIASLPDHFDSRVKWPECSSLSRIGDQGSCGSCWAFGAVEAMTDRICIYSNGTKKIQISAQDLISCCKHCGGGCYGGQPIEAWSYWQKEGLVSGGPYNSSQGCRPYEIAPCNHVPSRRINSLPPCHEIERTPICKADCESNYNTDYSEDKHKGKRVYQVYGEDNIKAELFLHGPVEASFTVYNDFIHYKSGVYLSTTNVTLGRHAVKLLGWGVEDGAKYWLVANSWNSGWGEKGYFKIRRGIDECEIEEKVLAGEPELD